MKSANLTDKNRLLIVSLFPNIVNTSSVIEKVDELVHRKAGGYICFATVHMVMESFDDADFGKKVNGADYIVTDGMPLVWMQKLQGAKDAERVRANDLMSSLCKYAAEKEMSVGFYGGTQEVIDQIQAKAGAEMPNLDIAYAYSPPFRQLSEKEDKEIVKKIIDSAVQILFVGLGCPKQENWMAAKKGQFPAVMLGVGASFDFYAGNVNESPEWMGKLGLEWLYRLTQEPKRLWRRYLILNPRFIWLATMQLLGLKKFEE